MAASSIEVQLRIPQTRLLKGLEENRSQIKSAGDDRFRSPRKGGNCFQNFRTYRISGPPDPRRDHSEKILRIPHVSQKLT